LSEPGIAPNDQWILFEDLHVGQAATLSKTITEQDPGRVTHGMLPVGLIAPPLGIRLPGPGMIYTPQSLKFRAPVKIGHIVDAVVEITDLNLSRKSATLQTRCLVKEDVVIDGEAIVLVPTHN
jgi:3-hydroxybutyryl-CoA dehydratase